MLPPIGQRSAGWWERPALDLSRSFFKSKWFSPNKGLGRCSMRYEDSQCGCNLAMYVSRSRNRIGSAPSHDRLPFFSLGAPAKPCGQVRQMLNPRTFGRPPANTPLSAREFDSTSAQKREKDVKDDLSQRLKSVCNHLSKAEFATLVGDMTREQLRGERTPGRKANPW